MFSIVNDAEAFLRNLLYTQPKAWLAEAQHKVRDLPKTNFELGCDFADRGMWRDALFRFKITLFANPKYPQARYNLGCCYYRLGKIDKAREELKQVLKETPNHQDAIFMLGAIDPAALTPEQRPKHMPRELITKFFATVATNYNQIEAANKYRGGVLVAEQVKPLLPQQDITVVDLGCGSGIASIPYRSVAQKLIGVEFTPEMAAQARATGDGDKKLFDTVIEADIASVGEDVPSNNADLVLLVNVAQFIGGLEAAMQNATRMVKPGGYIAVTIEPYSGQGMYGLVADTGKFGHTTAYLKHLATANQLTPAKQTSLALYPAPAPAVELIVLRKGGN